MGTSKEQVSRWENGRARVYPDAVVAYTKLAPDVAARVAREILPASDTLLEYKNARDLVMSEPHLGSMLARRVRMAKGLTQSELGEQLAVSQKHISRLETEGRLSEADFDDYRVLVGDEIFRALLADVAHERVPRKQHPSIDEFLARYDYPQWIEELLMNSDIASDGREPTVGQIVDVADALARIKGPPREF